MRESRHRGRQNIEIKKLSKSTCLNTWQTLTSINHCPNGTSSRIPLWSKDLNPTAPTVHLVPAATSPSPYKLSVYVGMSPPLAPPSLPTASPSLVISTQFQWGNNTSSLADKKLSFPKRSQFPFTVFLRKQRRVSVSSDPDTGWSMIPNIKLILSARKFPMR